MKVESHVSLSNLSLLGHNEKNITTMTYFKSYLRIILKTVQKCIFLLESTLGFLFLTLMAKFWSLLVNIVKVKLLP